MSNQRTQDVRRRSVYEPKRRRLVGRPSLLRSATSPPMESQHPQHRQVREQQEQQQRSASMTAGSNMRVYVRCRSRNQREIDEKSSVVISTLGAQGKEIVLSNSPNSLSQHKKTYAFDQVFGAESDQETVFNSIAKSYIHEMLQGYNCTVFAYGQTGTGKTYTMSGDIVIMGDLDSRDKILLGEHAGIIPRVLVDLFKQLSEESDDYSVKISFLELYNERLKDLLADNDEVEEKIRIFDNNAGLHYGKQNSFTGSNSSSSIMVKGMEEMYIKSATEGLNLLMTGSLKRKVAATKCNDLSSRSHTVFTITTNISRTDPVSGEQYIKIGKLNLVDLAGSENINRSGAENKRAQEAGLINKSLLTLGRVINALVDNSQHIPYRGSKLTRLLQDSLGGKTKTCIIATISPAKIAMDETVSTLEYATRARSIKNTPQINQSMSKNSCIAEYINEIDRLRLELKASRQKEGMYITQDQYDLYESNGILVEEQKVRIQNMEEQIKKFKEKYVEQTDLNKMAEQKLKESEMVLSSLTEQKKDILQTFENYQTNCNQYAEKINEIHLRNLELIDSLHSERNTMHEISLKSNELTLSVFEVVKTKTSELETLNKDLESCTNLFRETLTHTVEEIEKKLTYKSQSINAELTAIDFGKYVIHLQGMHSALVNIMVNFKKIPWDEETNSVYALHRRKMATCYQTVNEYHKSLQASFMDLLKNIQKNSKSSIIDLQHVGQQRLEDLFNIIFDQEEQLIQLNRELEKNQDELKKSNTFALQLQSYFEDRVSKERSRIFGDIIASVKNAEQRQLELDDEILHHNVLQEQESRGIAIDKHISDMNKVGSIASGSLGTLRNSVQKLKSEFQVVSEEKTEIIDSSFPFKSISNSFHQLSQKLSKQCDEVSSEEFKNSTRELSSKIYSNSNLLELELNKVSSSTEKNLLKVVKQDRDHVQIAIREAAELSDPKSKQYVSNFCDDLNNHGKKVAKFLDRTKCVATSMHDLENLKTIPVIPKIKTDVQDAAIREIPRLNSPREYEIYKDTDKINSMKRSHSPSGDRLIFIPSTPVPVPDQPLLRVLAPRSINSKTKRSHTHPTDLLKSHLTSTHFNNDSKRRSTTEVVLEVDDDLENPTQQSNAIHKSEMEYEV